MLKKNGLLYLIIDREIVQKQNINLLKLAKTAAEEKIDFIQYRFKNTSTRQALHEGKIIAKAVKKHKTKFIINDRPDIAKAVGSDGVHLGKDDLPPQEARKILGKKAIIGKTAHNKRELNQALKEPIDYIGIGPVFKTKSKPSLSPLGIKKAKALTKNLDIPFFLIGGINKDNIKHLLKNKLPNICLTRGLLNENGIRKSLLQLRMEMKSYEKK